MSSTGASEAESPPLGAVPRSARATVPLGAGRSLREALNGSSNSLGILRLVLASLVIVDHAFILSGLAQNPIHSLTRGQASMGSIAVLGFFAISGYLIAKSGMSGDVVQFMWRRSLRILPAFWGVLIFTAFVVAPLLWVSTGRSVGSLLVAPAGPLQYVAANWTLSIGQFGIADLLLDTPYGQTSGVGVLNGSLWTLIHEWSCYLIVGALVAFGVMARARLIVPAIAAYLFAVQLVTAAGFDAAGVLPSFASGVFVPLGLAFFTSATFAVYSDRVPFDDRLGALAFAVTAGSLLFGGFSTVGIVAGAYFIMYLGARLPQAFHWIGAKNDYSYGIYIYGFLMQQVGAHLGVHEWGVVPFIVLAWLATFVLAWLSWHGVEKRAMNLKTWGPGMGWRYWSDRVRLALRREVP